MLARFALAWSMLPDRAFAHDVVSTGSFGLGVVAAREQQRDVAALAPELHVGVRPRPEVELNASAGVATLSFDPREGSTVRYVRPANLGIGAAWFKDRNRFQRSLGIAFALPTAFVRSPSEIEAYRLAIAGLGSANPWLWEPATASVVLLGSGNVQLGHHLGHHLGLVVDGAIAGMFSAGSNPAGSQLAARVGLLARTLWPRFALRLGVRAVYNGRAARSTDVVASPGVELALCRRAEGCAVRVFAATHVNLLRMNTSDIQRVTAEFGLTWFVLGS